MLLNLMAAIGTPAAPDVTTQFTYAQSLFGYKGAFDNTTTANRRRWYANGMSSWVGYITGKSARMYSQITGSPYTIQIDGGAESAPTVASGAITLFSGLSDTPHLVFIRITPANSNNNGTPTTGNVFEITGSAPAMGNGSDLGTAYLFNDPSFTGLNSSQNNSTALVAAPVPNVLPKITRSSQYNVNGAVKIRAKAESIWVFCGDNSYGFAVDGAYPTIVNLNTGTNLSNVHTWKKVASGLDVANFHDYLIVPNGVQGTNGSLGASCQMVMIGGTGHAYTTLTSTTGILQIGDSITETRNYVDVMMGNLDTYKYANALGLMPYALGKQGQTTAGLLADYATEVAKLPVVPTYCVIAIGANDSTGATFENNLISLINAVLTSGVTKIACRVIATQYTTAREQNIINAVASFADPDIIYVGGSQPTAGTNLWTGITGQGVDTLHPNAAGYVTYADYEVTAFTGFFTP